MPMPPRATTATRKQTQRAPRPHLSRAEKSSASASVNTTLLRCHAALQGVHLDSSPSSTTTEEKREEEKKEKKEEEEEREIYFLALSHAEDALAKAVSCRIPQARARAHLYRGHCLVGVGAWKLAHEAYVSAASVRGPGQVIVDVDINALTRQCLDRMGLPYRPDGLDDGPGAVQAQPRKTKVRFSPYVVVFRGNSSYGEDVELLRGGDLDDDGVLVDMANTTGQDEVLLRDLNGLMSDILATRPSLRRIDGVTDMKGGAADEKGVSRQNSRHDGRCAGVRTHRKRPPVDS